MNIRTSILETLQQSNALCDDCLAQVTAVTPRQSINSNCRVMESTELLARTRETCLRRGRVKIVNRLDPRKAIKVDAGAIVVSSSQSNPSDRPWYWEGNVQKRIVELLKSQGCTLHSESDTISRQQGKDIVARADDGRAVWVTVKGFPDKSKNTQARHWFAGALLDLARYRDEDPNASLAMGLPRGFTTYEGLIKRTGAVRQFLGYAVYWVQSDGTVTRDDSPTG